jgi:hypothetical protein
MSDPTSGSASTGATWAVPDSRPPDADPLPSGPTSADGPGSTGPPAPDAGPPPVPVDLRPLTALERVDGGLRVLKLAPATMVAIAACTVVPVQLLASLVPDDPSHPADPMLVAWLGRGAAITLAEDSDRAALGVALLALESIALAVATAATAVLVAGWYAGRRPGTGEVLRAAVGRLPALVAAWALVHAAGAVAAIALVVGALVPLVLFSIVTPVLAGEGLGVVAALRRSVALTKRRPAVVFGACLSIALADLALRGALSASSLLWTDLGLPAPDAVAAAVGVGTRLVTVPMVAGAIVLLHLELRVRVEGHDLDIAAEELWPDAPR